MGFFGVRMKFLFWAVILCVAVTDREESLFARASTSSEKLTGLASSFSFFFLFFRKLDQ